MNASVCFHCKQELYGKCVYISMSRYIHEKCYKTYMSFGDAYCAEMKDTVGNLESFWDNFIANENSFIVRKGDGE